MIGIDAGRNVAGMADDHTVRDWASVQTPGVAVGTPAPAFFVVEVHVTGGTFRAALNQPTGCGVAALDACPESIYCGVRFSSATAQPDAWFPRKHRSRLPPRISGTIQSARFANRIVYIPVIIRSNSFFEQIQ